MNTLVLRFERMGHGAEAVGRRDDGKVVLAVGAAPGDLARVRVVREHNRFIEAEVEAVLEASPDRREPPCPHHRAGECGGCAWQHLTLEAQRREKEATVRREVARVDPDAVVTPIRGDVPGFGYRRRARFGHRGAMLGYRRRGERRIFDLETCAILDPRIDGALGEVREAVADWPSGNVDVMVDEAGDVVVGGPARSFVQPSATAEAVLIERVLAAIPAEAETVAELFAGSGTFTAPLAARGHRVRAWEDDKRAVAQLSRITGVEGFRADLLGGPIDPPLGHPDAVLLDPPRKGAAPCMEAVVAAAAPVVVYVSCEPMTLCRDLRALVAGGYRVERVEPVDAFPQTPHVECVARCVWMGS